jgi:hypothetical protein
LEIRIGVGWAMGLVTPFLWLALSHSFISTSSRQIPDGSASRPLNTGSG